MNKIKIFYINEHIGFNILFYLKRMLGWFGWYDVGFSNKIIKDVWYLTNIKIEKEINYYEKIIPSYRNIYI
jgi:hypothetical protein